MGIVLCVQRLLFFTFSFVDALLDTYPHDFNKSEENQVIDKSFPERSIA